MASQTASNGQKRIVLDAEGEITLSIGDILTGRGFITGKSGSGKSKSASVIIEDLVGAGYPILIVDTDGLSAFRESGRHVRYIEAYEYRGDVRVQIHIPVQGEGQG